MNNILVYLIQCQTSAVVRTRVDLVGGSSLVHSAGGFCTAAS